MARQRAKRDDYNKSGDERNCGTLSYSRQLSADAAVHISTLRSTSDNPIALVFGVVESSFQQSEAAGTVAAANGAYRTLTEGLVPAGMLLGGFVATIWAPSNALLAAIVLAAASAVLIPILSAGHSSKLADDEAAIRTERP